MTDRRGRASDFAADCEAVREWLNEHPHGIKFRIRFVAEAVAIGYSSACRVFGYLHRQSELKNCGGGWYRKPFPHENR